MIQGNIPIKTDEEIIIMVQGGKILSQILQELKKRIVPGIETIELDQLAEKLIKQFGVKSSFKNYKGYPATICASINEEVVHGIPCKKKIWKGDIISIDCGLIYKNFHVDATVIAYLEPLPVETKKFINIAEQALNKAIEVAKPGNKIGDISAAIEETVRKHGYSPVYELTGHGVGRQLHENPSIPNYGKKGSGPAIVPGMTLAIEPIINMGQRYIKTLPDGWTIVTKDKSLSVQVEHTIAITQGGNKILTKL